MIMARRLALSVLFCAAHAHAQTAAQADAAALENLVVSASRTPLQMQRVGSSLTVIDRSSLEIRQQTLVADALREVPGVAISRGGGLGAVTQARIRGSEGNHALVLIDGVEANNPVADSEFDFANLLVSEIERIEVLRGPQSALYGSDAIGGVINIITRERTDGLDASVHLEGGSLGTHQFGVAVGGGGERLTGGIALQDFASDGENASRSGYEKDGFENRSMSLHGRAALTDGFELTAKLRYLDSQQDFDSQDFDFPATPTQGLLIDDAVSSRLQQWFFRFEGNLRGDRLSQRFGVSETQTDNRFFDADVQSSANNGEKSKFDYQLSIDLSAAQAVAGHSLTFVLETERSDYRNRGATPDAFENQTQSDKQDSVAAEYRMEFARADLSLSARYDINDLFEDADTYRVSGRYTLSERARLHTSLGTGIANPGFFDLYGFFPGSFVGNPQLTPELSTSFDIGVDLRINNRLRLDATYFRADLQDEIQPTFDSTSFLSSVTNLDGDSERRGVELSLDAELASNWNLAASYTYTDAEQPDGQAEVRRARHIASLNNTFQFAAGRGRVNLGIDYNGRQYDSEFIFATPESVANLSAFTLLRLSADFTPRDGLRVYARVENLLDEAYEEWFSYRGRGRAFVAGVAFELAR
jgi:vitamin B12 transporter